MHTQDTIHPRKSRAWEADPGLIDRGVSGSWLVECGPGEKQSSAEVRPLSPSGILAGGGQSGDTLKYVRGPGMGVSGIACLFAWLNSLSGYFSL